MFRKVLASLLVPLFLLSLGLLMAGGQRANPRKGKVFFKKYCRTCHDGSIEAPVLQPITKTMDQWSREFEKTNHVQICLPRVTEQSKKVLITQDLIDIQSYLVQHAADSDQPATCSN